MLRQLSARIPLFPRVVLTALSAFGAFTLACGFTIAPGAPVALSSASSPAVSLANTVRDFPAGTRAAAAQESAAAWAAHAAHAAHVQHLAMLAARAQQAREAAARLAAQQKAQQKAQQDDTAPAAPAAPVRYSGGVLTAAQVGQLWLAAGGPSWAEPKAVEIARCESGFNPDAYNPSGATGLWQILGAVVPGNLTDPSVNAANAVAKFKASGDTFAQWVCQ